MAKIKKTTLDAGEIQIDATNSVMKSFESKTDQHEMKVPINEVVEFKTKIIDKDIQSKLDSYAQMEQQNVTLIKEKSDLETKLAEYIEEIASLKSQSKTSTLQDTSEKTEKELTKLNDEIRTLKESISQYLRRISDLTFENANLTAQLKEMSSKSAQVQNTIPSTPMHQTKLESPTYDPYAQNGYSFWN